MDDDHDASPAIISMAISSGDYRDNGDGGGDGDEAYDDDDGVGGVGFAGPQFPSSRPPSDCLPQPRPKPVYFFSSGGRALHS